MSHFDQTRREPLLSEQAYLHSSSRKETDLADPALLALLDDPRRDASHSRGLQWDFACMALELTLQRYSGGEHLERVASYAQYTFVQFDTFFRRHPAEKLKPWDRDHYQYILWLLTLAVCFGLEARIADIAHWTEREDEQAQDELLHQLFSRLDQTFNGGPLLFPEAFEHLLPGLDYTEQRGVNALTEYLSHWPASVKGCYWHDRHQHAEAGFFGYWALEAALVTVLWGIDDTPYRVARFYPAALVMHARYQRHDQRFPDQELAKRRPGWMYPSGTPCPWPGLWRCDEQPDLQQLIQHTAPFPHVNGKTVHWLLLRTHLTEEDWKRLG